MRTLITTTVAALLLMAPGAVAGTSTATVSGSGTITDDKGQMSCPPTCQATYGAGQVTFTATPAEGWQFAGWSGTCAQFTANTCSANGDFDATFGATFTEVSGGGGGGGGGGQPELAQVRVLMDDGIGRMTSAPGGIDCLHLPAGTEGGACVATFAVGTQVTLTVAPGLGYLLSRWHGFEALGQNRCLENATVNTCTFTVGRGQNIAGVMFTESPHARGQLKVEVEGPGLVDKNGDPLQQCPFLCRFDLRAINTRFTLHPRPFSNAVIFDRWEGYCASRVNSAGNCVVTADAQGRNTATARFRNRGTFSFETPRGGRIMISEAFSNAELACPPTCSLPIPDVGLWATPDADPGYVFVEWAPRSYCFNVWGNRGCSIREWPGTHQSRAVFRTVAGEGRLRIGINGPGRVSRILNGEESERLCPGRCLDDLTQLRGRQRNSYYVAFPNAQARFVRWEGCDSETVIYNDRRLKGCLVGRLNEEIPRDRLIRAVFTHDPSVRYQIVGRGRLAFGAGRGSCPEDCLQQVPNPGAILARAIPEDGSYFAGWSGACGGEDEVCILRDLPERVSAVANFRRFGTLRVRIQGSGTVRSVTGPRGEPAARFSDGDPWCQESNDPCSLQLLGPGRYRAIRPAASPGWHFKWFEGYCSSLIRPVPRECHIDGGTGTQTTTAVFERD